MFGVIGGSGLYQLDGLEVVQEHQIDTPFGATSGPIRETKYGQHTVYFLPRHGDGHTWLPTDVPYQANIWALKSLGVRWLISISAVGGLVEELPPGSLCIPDQFIDWTRHRNSTFFEHGLVAHVSMADPVSATLSQLIYGCATRVVDKVQNGGTYLCMEGPQFSSRAESHLYRQWGCHVIGMTNATEAKLAREAGIAYATMCFVTDYDCWKVDEEPVSVEQVIAVLQANVKAGQAILASVLGQVDQLPALPDVQGADSALITNPEWQSAELLEKLEPILRPFS